MSPEERQLIQGLFDRIKAAGDGPRDREAEAYIAEAVKAAPHAPYLLAQTTIVQDQALRAASERLQQLEAQVRDLNERLAQQPPQQQGGGFLSGLGSLFGGQPQQPPQQQAWGRRPPQQGGWGGQPQQPYGQPFDRNGQPMGGPAGGPWGQPQGGQMGGPQMGGPWGQQPGMMGGGMMGQPGGGGFLKGALGAAAGVAGGVLLADSIKGLFAGGHDPHGVSAGVADAGAGDAGAADLASAQGGDTIINNYYGDQGPQQADAGGFSTGGDYQNADYDPGYDAGYDYGDDSTDV
ncbi:DUF2076 domain-containing protein [Methylocella sp.]|uniref:DUF2076 domain-containing protein n=1 Tax=Methylocella sp. TaxID=1978226 RepID=UPI0037850847